MNICNFIFIYIYIYAFSRAAFGKINEEFHATKLYFYIRMSGAALSSRNIKRPIGRWQIHFGENLF